LGRAPSRSRLFYPRSAGDHPITILHPCRKDTITDHSFANIQTLAQNFAAQQSLRGIDPIGLDPSFPGLHNVSREGDPTAGTAPRPFDFYSPDTFNYASLNVSADGSTLTVTVNGIYSYATNTFPQPGTGNPVHQILQFQIGPGGTSPSARPVAATAGTTANLLSQVSGRSGAKGGTFTADLTVTNPGKTGGKTSPTVTGPFAIELFDLTAGATLRSATVTVNGASRSLTITYDTTGAPIIHLPPAVATSLAAGHSLPKVTLVFSTPNHQPVAFDPRVLTDALA
jgi:hypothetical protein